MKKNKIYLLVNILLFSVLQFNVIAQEEENGATDGDDAGFDIENTVGQASSLSALLGYTNIGGESFIGLRIQPELAIGKLGVGLDIPLMFSLNDGSLRTEEFKDGVAWARVIRYIRWGVKKKDPLYIRVGDLSGSYIGYGMLLDNYTNSTSFEKRKIGVTFDVLIKGVVGIEGLYSDFDPVSSNLLAIRPYVKPFGTTKIPILKTLDMGYSYVTDHDQTIIVSEDADGNRIEKTNHFINGGMSGWALDMGVVPLSNKFMRIGVYTQYGKLLKNESSDLQEHLNTLAYMQRILGTDNPLSQGLDSLNAYDDGSGFSVGAKFNFKFANILRVDTRLERLWYQKFFMPQFFNATYEFDKDAKLVTLAQSDGKKGIYGALTITALDKVKIGGTLMLPDNVSITAPAVLTINFDASQLIEKIVFQGQYIKGGLTTLSDAFVLDDRSLLAARLAYKLNKFLVVGLDYKWTWSKLEDGTFHATHYATPYFGLSIPLNLGSGGGKKDDAIDFGIE